MNNYQVDSTLLDIPYLKFDEPVTLTNCDREPIHIPGHAQAYGAVVALDPSAADLTILQVSANLTQFCGVPVEGLLGQGATALFTSAQVVNLRDAVGDGRLEGNPLGFFTGLIRDQGPFHATAHTYHGVLIVELEPAEGINLEQPDAASLRPDAYALLRHALSRLGYAPKLSEYCQAVCEAVHEINGFDRVMVYRFHADGHGEVIAEVIGEADTREPYLGLHYPESDIPKQARALFCLNSIRLMPDAKYEPAPIIPVLNPRTGRPLDMTHCVLRGYSQMYTEYLTNMGSRASMSLAIVRDGALWGLIACHHQSYRWVPYDVRTACEFLVDVVSLQIADKKAQEDTEYLERMITVYAQLEEQIADHARLLNWLTDEAGTEPRVTALSLLEAGGCAILSDGECRMLGITPQEGEIRALIKWLAESRPETEEVWSTDSLANIYPHANRYIDKSAGLLAMRVTTEPREGDWVLWFRPEEAQTVNWSGNPNKPYETGPMGDRLTPRKSFEIWQETARGRSLPWTDGEIECARRLRRAALTQIVAQRAEELARLNANLILSNLELDSFAYVASHDLKEPLRGIGNYIRFLREDHGDELTVEAEEKLGTVVRLVHRMEDLLDSLLHYSQLGRQDLTMTDVDLNKVLAEVLETLQPRLRGGGVAVRVPRPLPESVRCDAVQIGELYTNLITNAAKYNAHPSGQKWVEIGWTSSGSAEPHEITSKKKSKTSPPPIFFVRDNGIGISKSHFALIFRIFKRLHKRTEFDGGAGAGLTISQKIVKRHGGRIWLESVVGEGTAFLFTLAESPNEA